jgi:uncharacterized lipoprotein YddW (UPF0748 family)
MQDHFSKINWFLILLLASASFIFGQIERETRAVWVATNFRLDWPPQTLDQVKQKQALTEIFDNIKSKNLNTVFFQASSNGTTLFKSSFDPFSSYITGEIDGEASYDPLKMATELAHKRGLEIHAWLNILRCFTGTEMNVAKNPNHISQRKPEWVIEDIRDGQRSLWLDPGLPEVREYISSMIEELVENYDIDGVHLDYIRYPGRNFDDEFSYNIYGSGLSRDEYRRRNINDLVELINKKIKAVRHYVKLGAAPIGVYKNQKGMTAWEGYTEVYQDSREWLKRGIIDYVSPQIYWGFNDNPRFGLVAKDWTDNSFGRNIILGIGAYKPSVKPDMDQMIQYSRSIKASGVAFFRYENIKDEEFNSFQYKTYPAAMAWLDGIYPDPPVNLRFKKNDSNPKLFGLNWEKEVARSQSDSIRYYALYSLPDQNSELLSDYLFDVIPADRYSITVAIDKPKRANYFFTLKSVSKLWNESVKSSNIIEIKIPQLTSLAKLDDLFDKPVLIKDSEQKAKIILYLKEKETIEIVGANETTNKILFAENIPSGKNILSLAADFSGYKSIKVIFKLSSKEYELKL